MRAGPGQLAVDSSFPAFTEALGRHLSGLKGLVGIHAFLRVQGQWVEAARLGRTLSDLVEPALARYAPDGGGEVQVLAQGGWGATYMLGGPGLDLVLVLHLDGLPPGEIQTRLEQIEARVAWLMLAALNDRGAEIGHMTLGTEIGAQVLLEAAGARTRRQLADQWIARLERALSPDLIAVAWISGGRPVLAALSGGGLIERNSDARSQIEALADFAVRARTPRVITPQGRLADDPALQEAQQEALGRVEALGGARALAMPVYAQDEAEAVVIALWSAQSAAGPLLAEAADLVADVLGESLAIQGRAYPSGLRRLRNWGWSGIRAVLGPTAWKLKLFALGVVLGALVLAVWPTRYAPGFVARIEAQERRVVSAPFDGFLAEAPFQLGDLIPPGALVVALEDSELRLQAGQAQSELAGIEARIQTARAQRDSARVQSLEAEARQVGLRLDLTNRQIGLSRFVAPQRALVVGGEAWRRVGDRVRLGEPLLELADPARFRVLAYMDEDWVADLTEGAAGTLLLSAYPGSPVPVALSAITPDPQLRDGINSFSVWLDFTAPPGVALLDGMRGVVRIEGPATSALAAYTRGSVRWLRRTLWRWWG